MQHEIMLALGVGLLTVIVPIGVALQLTVQYRVLELETFLPVTDWSGSYHPPSIMGTFPIVPIDEEVSLV